MKPASLSNKRVLITGIDGFTGKALADNLRSKGAIVFGTTQNQNFTSDAVSLIDICERNTMKNYIAQIAPDFVIHLAAISFVGSENKLSFYQVNVLGTEILLDSLLSLSQKPQKVILASSATVYGNQQVNILDEGLCPNPVNHYGFSKLAMEQLAATYFFKLPIIITRPFNYTGPGQAEHFLIPKIVSHYKRKERVIELGNLDVAREFNDIRDVVGIYRALLLSSAQGKIVNLASGRAVKLLDVIETMNKLAGYEMEVRVNPAFVRENEIKELTGSTEKLENLVGAQYSFSLGDLLKSMYLP